MMAFAGLSLLISGVFAGPTGTVYIIRHGEKKSTLGCLNEQGHARAHALPDIFNGRPSDAHEMFATPKALFANYYGDRINCERTNQTIKPLARALQLHIDSTHGGENPGVKHGGGNAGAADAIRDALVSTGGPVLAAWEHFNIKYLTKQLGVPEASIPSWPDSEYDRVYILELNDGSVTSFHHAQQNFVYVPAPYDGPWKMLENKDCWMGVNRDTCSGSTVEDCRQECAWDPGCGGFNWPHKHMKRSDCAKVVVADIVTHQTLYLKEDGIVV